MHTQSQSEIERLHHAESCGGRFARRIATGLLALISIFVLLNRAISFRITDLFDRYSFNGDALQHIAPLWLLVNPQLEGRDFVLTYYWNAILPSLFKWIYSAIILFVSPVLASKVVTLILSVVFVATLGATSLHLAGSCAGYLTMLFATGAVLKNIYFMGGIQRGFGICLASFALYALATGRVAILGVLGILAASLYPAAAVFILTVLAITLTLPAAYRGSAALWTVRKRVVWLISFGILCSLVTIPQLIRGSRYGERLSIHNEVEFPEWSSSGRYTDGDRGVPVSFFIRSYQVAIAELAAIRTRDVASSSNTERLNEGGLFDYGSPAYGIIVIALTIVGALFAARRNSWNLSKSATRIMVFPVGTAVSFGIASALSPLLYIPSRYITLGIVPLVPVIFPVIWVSAISVIARTILLQTAASIAVGISAFIWLGWLDVSIRHLPSAAGHQPLFRFIRSLPEDSIIAGWPRGIINMVPLYTGRSVLLFEEGHQVFHRTFTEEAGARMRALMAAYSATERAPFDLLQQRYGVTHILVDSRHLEKLPTYFEPFNSEFRRIREEVGPRPLYMEELMKTGKVFSQGTVMLLKLTPQDTSSQGRQGYSDLQKSIYLQKSVPVKLARLLP